MGLEQMLNPFGFRTRVEGDNLYAEPYDTFQPTAEYLDPPFPLEFPTQRDVQWLLRVNNQNELYPVECTESPTNDAWHTLSTFAANAPLAAGVPGNLVLLELHVQYSGVINRQEKTIDHTVFAGTFTIPSRFAAWNGEGVVSLIIPLGTNNSGQPLTVSILFSKSMQITESGEPLLYMVHFEACGQLQL